MLALRKGRAATKLTDCYSPSPNALLRQLADRRRDEGEENNPPEAPPGGAKGGIRLRKNSAQDTPLRQLADWRGELHFVA